jgi:hypothetical protein
MPRFASLAPILIVIALAASGCGSKTVVTTNANGVTTTRSVPDIHFAKSKFLVHAGLAFGAFHRYIDKPFKTGAFNSGAPQRLRSIVKAGTAALFCVHELRTARDDALSDSHLRPLVEKVERLLDKLTTLGASLKRGSFNPAAIVASAGAVTTLVSASGAAGAAVKEVAPTL